MQNPAGGGAPGGPPPPIDMMQMLTGAWLTMALYVAAKLGVADLMAAGPQTSEELARATKTHAPSLYRLLRALASTGVFTSTPAGRFGLTPVGATLRSDVPDSMRAMAILEGEEWHWQPWGRLLHSVRTGEAAFDQVHGMGGFQYFAQHPEAGEIFNQAMTSFAAQVNAALVRAYDWSGIGTLVDVGGGHGTLLAAVLKANPAMRGVLFDLPSVVDGAQPVLEAEGVADRCEIVGGSIFEGVPPGGDTYLIKEIVHGFDDERAALVLGHCLRTMSPNGRVLVVETVIPPGDEPTLGKLLDLEMLVMGPGGHERTEGEFRALFERAGLLLTRIVPTPSPMQIVEGVRA
jgi:hypothetical protein